MARLQWRLKFFQSMQLFACVWKMCSCKVPPIIGIMAQELPELERTPEYSSFIYTYYVKAVESAGAQVVPIFINQTKDYYRDKLRKINGILIPGGKADFLEKGGIGPSSEIVISIAEQLNKAKDHFPILGICWGFELLLFLSNKKKELMKQCDCRNVSLPLEFKIRKKSRIYNNMPNHIYNTLKNTPVTYNSHKWCVTEENFTANNMQKEWKILTFSTMKIRNMTSHDKYYKLKFISSIESKKYPFVGLQFHPERTAFVWKKLALPRTREATIATRFFYDWLVDEATRSKHKFSSPEEEFKSLIWNYQPSFARTTPYPALPESQYYLFK